MKPFTPARIKADIIFLAAIAASFGLSLSEGASIALIGSAGLISAAIHFGEALIERLAPAILPAALGEIKTVESAADKLLPVIVPLLQEIPGKVGQEVRQALEVIEKGPFFTGPATEVTGTVALEPNLSGSSSKATPKKAKKS